MQTAKKILVTRPAHQSEKLCQLIAQQGWQAIRFPVIEIKARQISAPEDLCLRNIKSYRYVFFISVNAVNFALQLFNGKIESLQQVTCVAVGKATYSALVNIGLADVVAPSSGFNSEAVLALPELQILADDNCLIIRGQGGRELLADSLVIRGARVDHVEVYTRELPLCDSRLIEEYIAKQVLSAIVIYSGDALKNLMLLLSTEKINKDLLNVQLVVISQRVYGLAKQIGFKKIIIAEQATDTGMINALLNGEECGRIN